MRILIILSLLVFPLYGYFGEAWAAVKGDSSISRFSKKKIEILKQRNKDGGIIMPWKKSWADYVCGRKKTVTGANWSACNTKCTSMNRCAGSCFWAWDTVAQKCQLWALCMPCGEIPEVEPVGQ